MSKTETPSPVVSKSGPAASKSSPAASKSGPAASKSGPAASKSGPCVLGVFKPWGNHTGWGVQAVMHLHSLKVHCLSKLAGDEPCQVGSEAEDFPGS